MKCYKAELDPNNSQRTALLRHAGAARVAYNWGLQKKIEAHKAGLKYPTAIDLHRELVILKKVPKEQGGFPWMYEVSKCAPQEALRHLDRAFEGFFRRCKSKKGKPGFPKFKSRKRGLGSFTFTGAIKVSERTVQLPRLGVLRLKEADYFPTGIRIVSATVSERAGHWFVSVQTDEMPLRCCGTETLGVDVGIKSLAVLSDGTIFENPKALKVAEDRLRILQKDVSRKHKGSRNRKKAVSRLSKLHYRVSCIRKDAIHKATSAIVKRTMLLGIESLNVSGMMRNHCLARSLSDAGMAEFHRQLEYKMKWAGGTLVKADRWFPSSKTCSTCGHIVETLHLSVREWVCPACHARHDRDVNAAINLRNMAVSSTVTACCPGGSGHDLAVRTKLLVGQELNTRLGVVLNG